MQKKALKTGIMILFDRVFSCLDLKMCFPQFFSIIYRSAFFRNYDVCGRYVVCVFRKVLSIQKVMLLRFTLFFFEVQFVNILSNGRTISLSNSKIK